MGEDVHDVGAGRGCGVVCNEVDATGLILQYEGVVVADPPSLLCQLRVHPSGRLRLHLPSPLPLICCSGLSLLLPLSLCGCGLQCGGACPFFCCEYSARMDGFSFCSLYSVPTSTHRR